MRRVVVPATTSSALKNGNWRKLAISHSKMLTLVHSFFSSCGGLHFFRMDSHGRPRKRVQ